MFSLMKFCSNKLILKFSIILLDTFPAGNYMIKVNNENARTRCGISSKLTIKTPERRQRRPSGVFIVKLEHVSYLVLVFLFLALSR